MTTFNERQLFFSLANHNACGYLLIVELFSHTDCWYYLICHCSGCDLGHWVSPGTITEGIHWFHLMLPPASQRQGCSMSTSWVFIDFSGSQNLGSSSHIMPERTTTSGLSKGTQAPKHQKPQHQLSDVKNKWDLQPQVRCLHCTMAGDVPAAVIHREQLPGLSAALWPYLFGLLIPNVQHVLCLLKHGTYVFVFLTVSPRIFGSWQFERNAHAVQGSGHLMEKGQVWLCKLGFTSSRS